MTDKRLLYITTWDFTNAEADGVCKKILSQVKAFRKCGWAVDYTYIKQGNTWINRNNEVIKLGSNHHFSKFAAHRFIALYLKKYSDYQNVYIRYNKADFFLIYLISIIKNKGSRTLVEIPTYPYDNECTSCLRDRMVLFVDRLYRNRIKDYIYSFVSYSGDKTIFGAPSSQIINGIEIDKIRPRHHSQRCDNTINLIGVARFTPSHGYDRLIKSLGIYYNKGGKRNIVFHVVGYGTLEKKYKQLIQQYGINDHVILHGEKHGEELDLLYDEMDMGVCSLALFRVDSQIHISSELKSREYAAKGLPMLASCRIDFLDKEKCKFVYYVNNDESDIDIDKLIKYFDSIYTENNANELSIEEREYAKPHCNMEVVIKPIIDLYQNN